MTADKLTKNKLLASLDDLTGKIQQGINALNEEQLNRVPFKESWTAGQVTDHIIKSVTGIANALEIKGSATRRDNDERVVELKNMFLDYTIKFKSPEFILPTTDSISKEHIIINLQQSMERLKEQSSHANLSEAINHKAFGEITKLELLYFVKFHTQRHWHQLKNILKIITDK